MDLGLIKRVIPTNQGVSYNAVPLDSATQGLIDQDTKLSDRPASDFGNEINQGVQTRADQAKQTDQQLKQEAESTGQSPGMLSAIRNQYQSEASKGIGRIMDQNQMRGQLEKYQMTNQTAMAAMAQQNIITQNYSNLTDAYNQSMLARAQVLSSVLGAGGVGGVMAMRKSGAGQTSGRMPGVQTNATTDTYSNNGSALA